MNEPPTHPPTHPPLQDVVIYGGILLNVATKGTIVIYSTTHPPTHLPLQDVVIYGGILLNVATKGYVKRVGGGLFTQSSLLHLTHPPTLSIGRLRSMKP